MTYILKTIPFTTTYNSKRLEITQMSFNRRLVELTKVYLNNEELVSVKKKGEERD